MSFSSRLYRLMLNAYPKAYRDRYSGPMEQLFRDQLRQADSAAGFLAIWCRTLADWAVSVPLRHWERLQQKGHRPQLTDPARRCIFFARSEASSFSRSEITLEHLLLGLLREEPSLVSASGLEAVVRAIEATEPAERRIPPMEDLRLSQAAIRSIKVANEIARDAGRTQMTPSDFAEAILRDEESLAARLLREYRAGGH